VFIETSAPRVSGDKAWLISQQFNPSTTTQCLSFWYHMVGATIGEKRSYTSPQLTYLVLIDVTSPQLTYVVLIDVTSPQLTYLVSIDVTSPQ